MGGEHGESDPQTIIWNASDALSGLSHYTLAIDNNQPDRLSAPVSGTAAYTLRQVAAGEHLITVTAFDLAGNKSFATATVSVMPAPTVLTEPLPAVSPSFAQQVLVTMAEFPPRLPGWLLIFSILCLLVALMLRLVEVWQARTLATAFKAGRTAKSLNLVSLRKVMESQIIMLERADLSRRLTVEEEKIRRQLKRWVKSLRDSSISR